MHLDLVTPLGGKHVDDPVECLRGDVRNPTDAQQALVDIDVVFHLAARTGVGQSMYDIRHYVEQEFSPERMVRDYLAAYRTAIERAA